MDPALQEFLKGLLEFLKSLAPILAAVITVIVSWLVTKSMNIKAEGKFAEKAREAEIDAERQRIISENAWKDAFVQERNERAVLQSSINTLTDKLDREQKRNDDLEKKIKALESEQHTQEGKIRDLEQKNGLQTKEIEALTQQLAERNNELETMRKTVAKLETDLQQFQKANEKLTADNAAKDLQLSERANEVTALKEQIQSMQDRLDALEHPPTPPVVSVSEEDHKGES